jgi:hypothetical protein
MIDFVRKGKLFPSSEHDGDGILEFSAYIDSTDEELYDVMREWVDGDQGASVTLKVTPDDFLEGIYCIFESRKTGLMTKEAKPILDALRQKFADLIVEIDQIEYDNV